MQISAADPDMAVADQNLTGTGLGWFGNILDTQIAGGMET